MITSRPAFHQLFSAQSTQRRSIARNARLAGTALFLASVFLASFILSAQAPPRVSSVDPAMGKVNESITVTGENLDKTSVAGVFLSDDKLDYKAAIVDQEATKVVIKIPQVKAGGYNISIQIGTQVFIEPVRFTVQE